MKRILLFVLTLAAISCAANFTPDTVVAADPPTEVVSQDVPDLVKDTAFWGTIIGIIAAAWTALQHWIPTSQKAKSIINALIWLLVKLFPDRKKGGGLHEDPGEFPLKKKK